MRIEPNHGVEANAPPGTPLGGATPDQASAAAKGGAVPVPAPPPEADASPVTTVGPSDVPYVKQALATEDINDQAVAEARQLLQSGQLDTPQTAARAAQAMVDFGL